MQGRPIKEYRADGKYITKTYVCDSFGAEKNIDLADSNPFRYCSEYYDKGIDKIYLRARTYDPTLGRFTQQDPARDGFNWYVYCNGNPIAYADPTGLESYVFYTTGKNSVFLSQAQWQKDRLEKMGEKVIMIPVTDVKTFEEGWNGMGVVDGKSVDINYVMIYTHGNQRSMIFESGSSTKAMSIDGKNSSGGKIGNINDLQRKKIKELNLLSCNAGNLLTYWNEGENLASALSKKVMGGNTYAYDGNVSFGKAQWDIWGKDIGKSSRLATNQHGFNEIAKKYNAVGRRPLGKITYNNGEYKPYGYYPNTSINAK